MMQSTIGYICIIGKMTMVKPGDSDVGRRMDETVSTRGFSLIEVLIVIAILGVVSSMAVLAWQRFVGNNHLRTAAGDLVADIALYRQKAVGQNDNYTISFEMGNNSYTITNDDTGVSNPSKSPSAFGSGCALSAVTFPANEIKVQSRGLLTNGTITLTNSRDSTATIKISSAGRTDTQFAMQ